MKSHSKAEGSTFFDTMRLIFSEIFLLLPHQFLIFCNRMDVQKIPKGPPFTFFGTVRLTGDLKKNFEKIFGKFFPQFSVFLRAFVVSSCRKSSFRVLLSLRYGADLGRSLLVVTQNRKLLIF